MSPGVRSAELFTLIVEFSMYDSNETSSLHAIVSISKESLAQRLPESVWGTVEDSTSDPPVGVLLRCLRLRFLFVLITFKSLVAGVSTVVTATDWIVVTAFSLLPNSWRVESVLGAAEDSPVVTPVVFLLPCLRLRFLFLLIAFKTLVNEVSVVTKGADSAVVTPFSLCPTSCGVVSFLFFGLDRFRCLRRFLLFTS